jgi:hypothetical protein
VIAAKDTALIAKGVAADDEKNRYVPSGGPRIAARRSTVSARLVAAGSSDVDTMTGSTACWAMRNTTNAHPLMNATV